MPHRNDAVWEYMLDRFALWNTLAKPASLHPACRDELERKGTWSRLSREVGKVVGGVGKRVWSCRLLLGGSLAPQT